MLAEILLAWSFLIAPIYGLDAQTKSVPLDTLELTESDSVDDYFPTDRPRLELMPWSSELESQPAAPPKPPRIFTYEESTRPPVDTEQRVFVYEGEEPTKKNRIVKTIKLKIHGCDSDDEHYSSAEEVLVSSSESGPATIVPEMLPPPKPPRTFAYKGPLQSNVTQEKVIMYKMRTSL
ncbi:hypothetical protein D918_08059 [Trichuris suis]|nr:hypothetical protein D918_08059 [Trichuris suis]